MDGSAFRGLGEALVAFVQFAIFTFITLITTIILLILAVSTVWSYWYLSLYAVSTFLAWLINRRIV